MNYKVELHCKRNDIRTDECAIGAVEEIPHSQYVEFKHNLIGDYNFIKENNNLQREDPFDEVPCLLVLTPGEREGILVDTEGYDYAKYTAFIPDARGMLLLDRYPSLRRIAEATEQLTDRYAAYAVDCQQSGMYRIPDEDIERLVKPELYNESLFIAMLNDRPEISHAEKIGDEIFLTLAPEYVVQERDAPLAELSQDELEVMCARHVLWLNDAGGERADFSGTLIKDMDLSHKKLNGAILDNVYFKNVRMRDAELCFASSENAVFDNCDMTGMTAEEATFRSAKFRGCNLSDAYLTHSNLTGATFENCNFDCASLRACCVQDTVYSDCDRSACDQWNQSVDEKTWLEEGTVVGESMDSLS